MTVVQQIKTSGCSCDAPEQLKSLVSLDTAVELIARTVRPLSKDEQLPLTKAHGRVLAEPIVAKEMAPPFDNSAMDGYAINCAALPGDGPWTVRVSERVPAGDVNQQPFTGNEAVRIFTGAPVPNGADAVIAQEDVKRVADSITIPRRPDAGCNIRLAGTDMRSGDIILNRGARLGSREVAVCASAGATHVRVKRPLRVSLLVTGNEVRNAGAARQDAQIWDINTPMIAAALSRADINLFRIEHGADNRDALRRSIAEMSEDSDLVITTGGISVGEEDHVKPVMRSLGADVVFSGVAIKPGKPVSFGRIGNAIWLGLPGNPLSVFVTWQVFGTAILRAFLDTKPQRSARRHVIIRKPILRKPGRCELRLARIVGFDAQGREVVDFDKKVRSGQVAGLRGADGLILLPSKIEQLPEGALVEFHPFCAS